MIGDLNSKNPEDVWAYRVACYWQGVTEERAREAARLAMSLPGNLANVWHVVSVLTGKLATCHCSPCTKARGEKPVCL